MPELDVVADAVKNVFVHAPGPVAVIVGVVTCAETLETNPTASNIQTKIALGAIAPNARDILDPNRGAGRVLVELFIKQVDVVIDFLVC